jgi:uncharacterized protein
MKAIDVHCHPSTQPFYENMKPYIAALEKYWKESFKVRTEEEMIQEFEEADVQVLLVALDSETVTGLPKTSNDYIADLVKKYPDTVIGGWGSVDPWKGDLAIYEAERAIKELGLIGFKFHQILQRFYPNDPRFNPLWKKLVELKCPVQFHMGTTGMGAGVAGGMGEQLNYAKPIPYLDDLAANFPHLTVIGLHPSFPWTDEMKAIVLHKANVYWDLSGWAPKYFDESLKRDINSRLKDKVLFGSDYPSISHKRLLKEWKENGHKEEILEKVFYKNAQRVLRLK